MTEQCDVQAGADANLQDAFGDTALHVVLLNLPVITDVLTIYSLPTVSLASTDGCTHIHTHANRIVSAGGSHE